MTEFGKIIDKPEAEGYKNKNKIYFVRNLFLPENPTEKYKKIFNRYWDEALEHLERLEVAGKISKIFCESIYMQRDEALKVLSKMNARLEQIVSSKIEAGAEFLPLESKEIFGIYVDWYNCLTVVRTERVLKTIHDFLDKTIEARFQHIKSVLKDNIKDGAAALLIMRDEDRGYLKVPEDIELFLVSPPAYDDLMTYIRDSKSEKEYWRT